MIKQKFLTALLALLTISATAWADEPKVYTSAVTITSLQVGDILAEGAQVSGLGNGNYKVFFAKDRYWDVGSNSIGNVDFQEADANPLTVGANGVISGLEYGKEFSPVDDMGAVVNAWEVYNIVTESGNHTHYYVQGIQYDAPAGLEVTINSDKSEASFEMPAYDVTTTYAVKRDMSVDMTVTVQDEQQNSRFRVQKQGNDFVPVGLTNEQVMALFNVRDQIEEADLTATTDYTVQIFAADKDGKPTGTAMTFATFTYAPGQYIVKAVAAEGSNYVGETALSNVFTLYQGYEVTVPAGEYITYYQNEALTLDETETAAQLYTISSVTDTEAQLSEQLTVAPAETPLLVYNNSEETKTFLLIPTTETADEVTAAKEFRGTLEATTIPASTTSQDNYALNGKAFVWVKYEISIAANKCWLQIGEQPAATRANTRSITGSGDTTGIKGTDFTDYTDGDYYDLQGRKVSTPSKKGIYIKNGQKVIIK